MKTQSIAPQARVILFVDETMFVEGHGFRPVFVVEGEAGFRENGNWPYTGEVGQTSPWFFGPTLDDAKQAVREHNERLGVGEATAFGIVARSMKTKATKLRPSLEGIGVTTPRSAAMIELLGMRLDYDGLALSGDEYKALAKLYGYKREPPTERPPKPEYTEKPNRSYYEKENDVRAHADAVKQWEKWEDPRVLMQAGADRNLTRDAASDGMRLIAWLARYVLPGTDPLKTLIELGIDAGLDVDPSDVTWAESQD